MLADAGGRTRIIGLVLVAVLAQIARNWLMLGAVGVHATVLDATAVLIAMVTLSQLPVGPGVGAATVLILGTDGPAAAAAAGVLQTATGAAGALAYAVWAACDRVGTGPRGAAARATRRPRRPSPIPAAELVLATAAAARRASAGPVSPKG